MDNKRNSSLELLRIIAMFLIVVHHYSVHGGFDLAENISRINRIILDVATLGNLGVDVFIMITGYFLIKSNYSLRKPIRLWGVTIFYSVGYYCLMLLFGKQSFSIFGLFQNALPVIYGKYWFMTTYLVLYLFVPYINIVIKALSKKELLKLIILMFVLWSVIPTVAIQAMGGNEFLQFIMAYTIGAYIALYTESVVNIKKISSIFAVTAFILLILSSICLESLGLNGIYFYARNSILVLIISTALVIYFTQLQQFTNTFINKIAGCTLGVYLIHDNKYIREILWVDLLKNNQYAQSPFMIVHMLIATIMVFVVCILIEELRSSLIQKSEKVRISKINNKQIRGIK